LAVLAFVHLAPADVRKDGSALDLPIALAILAAAGQVAANALEGLVACGELALDGTLRPVRGALSMALAARAAGSRTFVVPAANAPEAAVVEGLDVRGAGSLGAVLAHLGGGPALVQARGELDTAEAAAGEGDLSDVRGQSHARRALEVAAAGGHNLLLVGPPGGGKTLLARRLPSILPALSLAEALETTRVHSVAGLLPPGAALVSRRPFRAPHHTISDAGLVGGGAPPRPGEISLAHHGVLFLDKPPARAHLNELARLGQAFGEEGRRRCYRQLSVTSPYHGQRSD